MFKDQLSRIYSMEEWPAYTELIPMLTWYDTYDTENINDLKKEIGTPLTAMKATSSGGEKKNDYDEQGGRRTVKNKVNKRYVCPCCGKKRHQTLQDASLKIRLATYVKRKDTWQGCVQVLKMKKTITMISGSRHKLHALWPMSTVSQKMIREARILRGCVEE
jgi:hypothetical protein